MVVCTYFQQGNCRNGQRCRFEHVYSSKYSYNASGHTGTQSGAVSDEKLAVQVSSDATEILRGGVWTLTGYSPFRDKSEFPGLLDVSPEESRHMYYEGRSKNAAADAIKYVSILSQDARAKYEQLLRPSPAIMKTIRAIYDGEKPPSPFNDSPIQASPVFGDALNKSDSMFYSDDKGLNSRSIFAHGSTGAHPIFAQSSSNARSVFAQGATNTRSMFTQGMTNPHSVFAQGSTNPQSVFAQGATNPHSVFAQGATNPQTVFAQSTSDPQSLFIQGANPQSVFAQGSANPHSVFVQSSNIDMRSHPESSGEADAHERTYSIESELSEEDASHFAAEEFILGRVPILPPPVYLCR